MRWPKIMMNLVQSKKSLESVHSGSGVYDPGGFFTEAQSDEAKNRLALYKQYRDSYEGKDRSVPTPNVDGDIGLSINLNRPMVVKSTDWLFGKEVEVEASPGNQALADRLMSILEENNAARQLWTFGHSGSITGDGYLHVYTDGTKDNPVGTKTFVRYLKPQFVHPIFHPIETDKMSAVMIQFPIDLAPAFAATSALAAGKHAFTRVITDDTIREYVDENEIAVLPNVFGEIPVYHAPNLINSFRWYGDSDLVDVWLLNELRNGLAHLQKEILEYNAAPTTIIIGASAKNIEKTPHTLLAIRNKDAKVQVLEMNSDLGAITAAIENLRKAYLELSGTPENSLGADQAISNTSAAALEVRYMCLVEKTRRKRLTYGRSLLNALRLVSVIEMARDPGLVRRMEDISSWRDISVVFQDPLPRDMEKVLNIEEQAMRIGVQSRYGALRNVRKKRLEETMIEIVADDRMQMLQDVERARAVEGNVPNLHANWLGSLGMHTNKDSAVRKEDKLVLEMQRQLQSTEKVVDTNEPTLV